ncbi:MAG: dockerin type I domain-containing protein [Ignavibacteria bacterium]
MKTTIQASLVLLFCCVLFSINAHAQVSQQWAGYYNSPTNGMDYVNAMTIDNSNNIYVTGVSRTSTTGKDFATVKYNSAGVQQWASRYNYQSNYPDVPVAMAVDNSGNVYVTGTSGLGGPYGFTNIIKYNSSGTQQWTARCGDSVYSAYTGAIALDASGNIYIGGNIQAYRTDDGSFHLKKFSPAGDSIWKRTYDPSIYPQGLGSTINCLKVDGNFIYAAGKATPTDGLFTVYTSLTIIKYDLNGNSQWVSVDSLVNGSDKVVDMDIDLSGNIFVTCYYGFDIVIYKYSPSGVRLWKKVYSGIAGDYYDIPTGIAADGLGNVVVTANSRRSPTNGDDDYLTMKYDASGNVLWEKFYNGTLNSSDYPYDVATDASNNVYVTGVSYETGFNFNAVTLKYNSSGVQQWAISFDGGNNGNHDEGNFIKVDSEENVIIAGYSSQAGHSDDFMAVKYSQSLGVLNLTVVMEGFYNPSVNAMNISDTAKVFLRNSSSPYSVVDSSKSAINAITLRGAFPVSAPTGNYYIELKHRNTIETWSNNAVSYTAIGTINYNFTTSSGQAFGSNQKSVDASPVRFAVYSGDVNQDGTIDATDLALVDNAAYNFISGYVNTDVTGDNFVDATDAALADNNAANFVSVIRP